MRRAVRSPLVWLAPLALAIGAGVIAAPWHSAMTVDDRTYIEMVDGIARHGLPWRDNGPVERFAPLRAQYNVARDGHAWGNYPPIFPYLAAPLYRLGGVRAVIRANVALLALLALGVFALARRLGGDERTAVAATWAALVGAPVWIFTFLVSPYTLAITALVWSAWFALGADGARAGRRALAAGALGGIAGGSHLIGLPMALGLGLALVAQSPRAWARNIFFAAGLAAALAPSAAINRLRFGSWNPASYGPCEWLHCAESGMSGQRVSDMAAWLAPVAACGLAALALFWALGRSRRAPRALALLALAPLALNAELGARAAALAQLAWGYAVDLSRLPLGGEFVAPPDGLGRQLGPYVIKSALQSAPLAALALFAPRAIRRAPLLLACAALAAALLLRANMPLAFALGYPFLNLRYVMFAMPFLMVLAALAVRDLPWRRAHLAAALGCAVGLGAWLLSQGDDAAPARRLVLLRGSLFLVAAELALFGYWRRTASPRVGRAAAWAIAATLGFSAAVNLAVDLRAMLALRRDDDRRLDLVAAHTPARVALIGWTRELDPVLPLIGARDVEYADLYELRDLADARPLIDWWAARGRPIYAVWPRSGPPSPWPELRLEPVAPEAGLMRVVRVEHAAR